MTVELDPDSDRRRSWLGPDRAGNLIEVIWLQVEGDEELVIHAMTMRNRFAGLLAPRAEDR